jgi:multicomponent Na+:H+ antiporter subunit C
VLANGIFLLFGALARRPVADPAVPVDPVPHAMVLTGIVVAVSVTAFALSLARRVHLERHEGAGRRGEAEPSSPSASGPGERKR